MRIKGLVQAYRSIRSRLEAGQSAEELDRLRKEVRSLVTTVEQICARHGMTAAQLPGPSKRVYRFLKEMDAGHFPVREPGSNHVPPGVRPGIRNVVRTADHFAERLWQDLPLLLDPTPRGAAARGQLLAEIGRNVELIEAICARQNASLGALEPLSRQAYCWLKFLASEENFNAHLAALERARNALAERSMAFSWPVTVHLLNVAVVWRKRQYSNLVLVKISEGFLNADSLIWSALMRVLAGGHDPQDIRLLREFTSSEDYNEVLCELESVADSTSLSPQGVVHNLDQSFARVNRGYFADGLAKPRLVWNRALTGRKFGHYRPSTDTVMLSVTLDKPQVPEWVVDFVMYHELLHKKHGISLVNGRRLAHTPAFRAEERQYARHQEAEDYLEALARNV